jgi:hypothetical protein
MPPLYHSLDPITPSFFDLRPYQTLPVLARRLILKLPCGLTKNAVTSLEQIIPELRDAVGLVHFKFLCL